MKLIGCIVRATIKPTLARLCGACACAASLYAAAATPARAQTLDEIAGAKQICETSPEARVARAERLAGAARVTAASVLPNPALVVGHQRAFGGATERETVVGVSVPLSIGGRRSLLQDAAAARQEQAFSDADSTLFESALAFRHAYASAILDQARVTVLEQQQATLEELSTTIAGLAKGGETADYDLLRQRMHARLHQRALESARARAMASHVLLEAWLGTKVSLPAVDLLALASGAAGDRHAVDGPALAHPQLRGLDAQARASALDARAADRRWVPELELFAGYRATTFSSVTGHGIALSLRVPLTFFDHGQGEAAQARAEQARALAAADSLRLQYSARLQSIGVQLGALSESAEQFASAPADAATLQEKARQLYAAGEATITELLEAFAAAEEARLAAIDLAEELAFTRLARMRAAGTQLDVTLDKACHATQRRAQ